MYRRTIRGPKLSATDRLLLVALSRARTGCKHSLAIVTADTVVRWQRRRFREYWDLTILPVGLIYDAPGTFRGGHALVAIGEPVAAGDLIGRADVEDEDAVHALTDRIAAALRREILEAEDRETLRLAGLVERLWRDEPLEASAAARVEWVRRALNAARYVGGRDPGRLAAFRRALEAYARDVGPAGDVEERYPASTVLRYALREGAALGLSLPLALVGLALNVVPYRLTGRLARISRSREMKGC